MSTVTALWSFALVVGVLTVTPGLDTALIVRTAASGERRRAWGVVLGIQTGTILWGVLTSVGITALLTASVLAYEVLRWAGAAYLIWLGIGLLRSALRGDHLGTTDLAAEPGRFAAGWRRGLATNLLNPKMGAFYVALLPQFIPAGAPPLVVGVLLACVHVVLGLAWSTVLVTLAHRMRLLLRRRAARRAMDGVTGGVVVAFGVQLALSNR